MRKRGPQPTAPSLNRLSGEHKSETGFTAFRMPVERNRYSGAQGLANVTPPQYRGEGNKTPDAKNRVWSPAGPGTRTPPPSRPPDRGGHDDPQGWKGTANTKSCVGDPKPSPPSRSIIHEARGSDNSRIPRPRCGAALGEGDPNAVLRVGEPASPGYVRPRDRIYLLDFFNPILDAFFLTASVGRPSDAATSDVGRSGNSFLSCFTSSLVHEPFVPILAIS